MAKTSKRIAALACLLLVLCPATGFSVTWLKQSTAATVKLGPFVDSTDGVTAETGLTIAQSDIRLSKNGGSFAQSHNAAGATHDENGWYGIPLDTTDTGTLGNLTVAVYTSGALPVWKDFMVVPANIWDSLFGGTDNLQVDAVQWGGTAVASVKIAATLAAEDVSGNLPADVKAYTVQPTTFDPNTTPVQASTAAVAAIKTGMQAPGSSLALILEDTGTTLPALLPAGFSTVVVADGAVNANASVNLDAEQTASLAAEIAAQIGDLSSLSTALASIQTGVTRLLNSLGWVKQ